MPSTYLLIDSNGELLSDADTIGMAACRGWDQNGLAVWTLTIGGQEIAGRWIIVDREFTPAQR